MSTSVYHKTPQTVNPIRRRSASGWTQWAQTTKAAREDIRRQAEGIPLPQGVRCGHCNRLVAKLYPTRRADPVTGASGIVVPMCLLCRTTMKLEPVAQPVRHEKIITHPYPLLPAPKSQIAGLLPAGSVSPHSAPRKAHVAACAVLPSSKEIIHLSAGIGGVQPPRGGPAPKEEPSTSPGSQPKPRAQYMRDPKLFTAAKSGGGGFIWFDGEIRSWNWIIANCACSECGISLGKHHSNVPADGLIRNATYFTCEGAERHVIRRGEDLKWKIGRQAKDRKHQAKATVKDVRAAYPWLTAEPDTEEMPF